MILQNFCDAASIFIFHRTFGGKGIGDKERESTQSYWGVVVIPKTVHKGRMEQNFNIWDFSLTRDKLEKIDALDMGHSNIADHNNPEFIKMLHSLEVHA